MKESTDKFVDGAATGLPPDLDFLQALHMLVSSARIHQDNNRLLLAAAGRFIAGLRHFLQEDDEISLVAAASRFYLQQEKMAPRAKSAGMIHAMLDFFARRRMGGLRFLAAAAEATPEAVASFARLLDQAAGQADPCSWLTEILQDRELAWAAPISAEDTQIEELASRSRETEPEQKGRVEIAAARQANKKEKALLTYGFARHSLQEIAGKVCANRTASIRKAVHMVHGMIDMVFEDSDVFLGLSTIRDYDDYTFTHSINVSILSMCLGHRIGLSRKSLESLGLSAMFHDLGKIDVPKEILNKPGKLTDREFREMKNHSLYSVCRIILLKTDPRKKAAMLLPPFEHHLRYDLSGYPRTPRQKPISLHGRIIALADVFDAITAPRVYRPFAISPDRALSIMMEGSGTDFDPVLLKYFINMVGVYPIGTLLRFDNGELGLVAKYTSPGDGGRDLWVRLLQRSGEGGFSKGDLINLGPLDVATGTFNRLIRESLHPSVYHIQPADYLL